MSQPDNIRVSTLDHDSPVTTVRVDGIVDTITSKEVDRAIEELIRRERYRIVMDLAGVDYISSAGWGVFISHLKEARERSGDLRLAGMIPNVREIFELLEFDTILSSFPTASQAAQSFEQDTPVLEGGPRAPEQGSNGGLDELAAIGVDAPGSVDADRHSDRRESTSVGAGVAQRAKTANRKAQTAEDALLELVAEDPFATLAELSAMVCERATGADAQAVGWWWVFKTLWREGLLSKRSRFRLFRQKSKSGERHS